MSPTLADGDNLIVDKISYRFHDPERFDIVVFPFRYADKTYYIKRIIGLPGETVYIDEEGTIYIDGEVLNGTDEYFVLGDNRNNSSDSRDPVVGNIHRDELIGKAWMRIYPFDQMCIIKHQ